MVTALISLFKYGHNPMHHMAMIMPYARTKALWLTGQTGLNSSGLYIGMPNSYSHSSNGFKAGVLLILGFGLMLGACAPTVSQQGYLAIEANPATDIKVGDEINAVRTKFGSPSQVGTFDPNVWYYVYQVTQKMTYKRPEVTARNVTVVRFDKDTQKVAKVEVLTLADGREFAINQNKTPTRGRELTALEQLLGNVGRQTLTNEEDQTPSGQRRRE
jgi:outer membrane protein assembly factor BamE (lipoprotein component of BamABCDE complex)